MNNIVEGTCASSSAAKLSEDESFEPPSCGRAQIKPEIFVHDEQWAKFGDVEGLVKSVCKAVTDCRDVKLDFKQTRSVAVALSNDEKITELNGTFRSKSRPTNVLSFPALPHSHANDHDIPSLGDIILSVETTLNEANELGIPPAHHIQHLIAHALLHNLGYDHENDAAANKMETLETKILASLGIPDPYDERDA